MEPYKRDLPEIVAEILIEQHAMRQDINEMKDDIREMRGDITEMRGDINEMRGDINEMRNDITEMRGDINGLRTEMREEIGGLREDMRDSAARMESLFSVMTNAVLDAMNRQTDRYDTTTTDVAGLRGRVEKLENQGGA